MAIQYKIVNEPEDVQTLSVRTELIDGGDVRIYLGGVQVLQIGNMTGVVTLNLVNAHDRKKLEAFGIEFTSEGRLTQYRNLL